MTLKNDATRGPKQWMEPSAWKVVERYHPISWGVQNMTHDEIVESILDDLLRLHFGGWGFGIPWYALFRFIQTYTQADRVLRALCDARIQDLVKKYPDTQIIRLKSDHDSLQRAMDIAGCWYEGFGVPDGVTTLALTQKGKLLLEKFGVEELAARLAHDFMTDEKTIP